MNNREQRIREHAYSLWENEGRPDGDAERHWQIAGDYVHELNESSGRHSNAIPLFRETGGPGFLRRAQSAYATRVT
jgi:hypothetical protein